MRILRTIASAVLILLGASLIALWAVSVVAVRAVEDGTALHGMAERALDDPRVVVALGETLGDGAVDALEERGIDTSTLGLDDALRALVGGAVGTDEFRQALLAQIDDARAQFAAQLTDALRDPRPLVLLVDATDYLNERIDSIPLVGSSVPDVTVPPVPVEVLDADTFETVRSVYSVMEWAKTWALWAGIALIVVGMVVTQRLRWFLAKTALAVGAIAGGLWAAMQVWGVDGIVAALPGGRDGGVGTLITRVMTEETVPLVQDRLLAVAFWALGIAAVAFAIAVLVRPADRRGVRG